MSAQRHPYFQIWNNRPPPPPHADSDKDSLRNLTPVGRAEKKLASSEMARFGGRRGEKGEGSGRAAESVDKGYMPERENMGTESPLVFS